MNLSLYVLDAGQDTYMRPFAEAVTQEFPEYRWVTDRAASIERFVNAIEANERVELVYKDAGQPVAGAVLVAEEDVHVGPCLTVQGLYVMPAYRAAGLAAELLQQAEQLARSLGLSVLSYTRRIGDVRYENVYRRLNGKES